MTYVLQTQPMNLTKLISARISKELSRQIKDEVRTRKLTGVRVNEADVVREALAGRYQRAAQSTEAQSEQKEAA